MKKLTKLAFGLFTVLCLIKCAKDGSGESPSFDGTGLSGSTARFVINGNTMYTVDNTNLQIFNIVNGSKPVKVGSFAVGRDIETISTLGDKLFIGSQGQVYLFSIQNATAPSLLGIVNHRTSCDPVVSDGQYAYSTLRSGSTCRFGVSQLDVISLSDPQDPKIIKSYAMTDPKGLAVSGKWLFVCDNGIKMYDKSDVNNLKLTSNLIGIAANDMIADDNVLIVVADDGIYNYDFSNGSLDFKGKIQKGS